METHKLELVSPAEKINPIIFNNPELMLHVIQNIDNYNKSLLIVTNKYICLFDTQLEGSYIRTNTTSQVSNIQKIELHSGSKIIEFKFKH